ncbi:cell filamentation protein [Catenuloplanes nepalensis]|uniref:protein adenylyltransferase n=1 Tax=Catenuloplanes nepalensis TaxID=587533 RepID=A0ABT9N041_9ACTN|nr:Fic family protein [Catenuloplanes nepalensis]MDP9796980.1 cell filamentation protein [Catenuloplanes nepalensis]
MTEEDPYVEDSGVLINKLGLTSAPALSRAEADLTFAAMLRISVHAVPGDYDLRHLSRFHREIFGAVYEWAGRIRTVNIARTSQDMFCQWRFIESYSAGVFSELAEENRLAGLTRRAFVRRLAHYYAEINAIHPFREGNGRTQRAFLRQLAREAGWRLAWKDLAGPENDRASAAALHGDEEPLVRLLDGLITPL